MLPFLRNKDKSVAGLIIKTRNPDEKPENEQENDESSGAEALEACASALIQAIHAKDIKAAAQAMKDAFDILESQPHDEMDEPHSYDAQNQLAAKKEY